MHPRTNLLRGLRPARLPEGRLPSPNFRPGWWDRKSNNNGRWTPRWDGEQRWSSVLIVARSLIGGPAFSVLSK